MNEKIEELVYETLLGNLVPECSLPWVETVFVPGHACYEEYGRMLDAYEHLCQRLGETDEDKDAETMINSLLAHGKILAMEMFRYGREYQRMLHAGKREGQ